MRAAGILLMLVPIALNRKPLLLQVDPSVDQMLHHYSTEGWLAYREPVPLSRQASVRVGSLPVSIPDALLLLHVLCHLDRGLTGVSAYRCRLPARARPIGTKLGYLM